MAREREASRQGSKAGHFGRKEPVTWIGVLPPPSYLLCYSAIGEASWEV